MGSPINPDVIYRFGVFEVFSESRELFRRGQRIQIQDQPFRLLLLLLEDAGGIVSREYLRQRLWPENTFVEFGQSLGTAVKKLRQALQDDADQPRFIETIPRRGYRFIAPVVVVSAAIEDAVAPPSLGNEEPLPRRVDNRHDSKLRPIAGLIVVAILAAAGISAYVYHQHNAFSLGPKDTIVVADFENTTGEAIFNDVLRQSLIVGLNQSPIVNVLPDRRSALVFRQMGHEPSTAISGRLAVELCQRVGGKVTVQGSISSLGTTYLVGLAAIRCDTGKPIAREQVEAAEQQDVIGALGKAASQLRAKLGESLPSIQKYNAPLELATTSSLAALNAYGSALSTWDSKGDLASIPLFQRAIQLDRNFAMAYGGLAAVYHNQGATELAAANTVAAYRLRDRVTESERTSIDARYYLYVTKEIDKAGLAYESLIRDYPDSASSLNHLGTADNKLGHPERAAEAFQRALALDPTRATTYANLAVSLMQLNRIQEAASVLDQAEKRGLHTDYLLQTAYWLAFVRNDQKGMELMVQQSGAIAGARSRLLPAQASTEAYHGRFDSARKLSYAAMESMTHDGDRELAANCLAQAAVREAEVGSTARARALMQQTTKVNGGKSIDTLAGVVAAETGNTAEALALADKLDKEFPQGTLIQGYWLPVIRALVELQRGHAAEAIKLLDAAEAFEQASPDEFSVVPLYPAYARGKAYLAKGDGEKANAEFRKLIDHPGMVLNTPLAALAHLGQARAAVLRSKPDVARAAYLEFFRMWDGADSDLPILRRAHIEYDRLPANP